jgi:ABC-type bacteriocin/lantibiotic exporter with double-glycine peptidase domain
MTLDPQRTVDLLVNILKNIEEVIYQDNKSVVLPNFPRTLQLDGWTCGARSVYSILRFMGKRCIVKSVERELKCDWSGTDVSDIKRVLAKHGLKYQEKKRCRISDLTNAIDGGFPILISTHDSWHYSAVFGYSRSHIFVMNPAVIGECGSLWCRLPRKQFSAVWDKWGIVVSNQ